MGLIEILWTLTGVIIPLLLGTAWTMVGFSPPEFWIARACIGISAVIFSAMTLFWLVSLNWPLGGRLAVAAILGTLSFVIFSEAFRLVNEREKYLIAQSSIISDKRAAIRTQLQQFYIESDKFINADLPKNISEEDFKKYSDDATAWANNTADWIGTNLGAAARAKFLDKSGALSMSYSNSVNNVHNNILNSLNAFRKNLSTLIETGAWDKTN